MSKIVFKNNRTVVRIKSPDNKLIQLISDKISELNGDGCRVVEGFIEDDKDGINQFLYINIYASPPSNEGGKK